MLNQTGATGRLLWIIAAVLGVATVGWLAFAQPTAAGTILCLGPAAVVIAALVFSGLYLNRRGVVEEGQAKVFEQESSWRDEERRNRLYVAERLEQAAARLGVNDAAPKAFLAELRGLAGRLRRPGYEQGVAPSITQAQFQALQSLDSSLKAKADELDRATDRWLSGEHGALEAGAAQLRQMVDRRSEVLLGEAQLKTAREVLAGGPTSGLPRGSVGDLKLNDAVAANGVDYSITGRLQFNDRGVQWSRLQVRGGGEERWLLTLNGGVDNYWLTPTQTPDGLFTASQWSSGEDLVLRGQGTAEVGLEGLGGERRGLLIDYRRFAGPDDTILWAERWPDGQTFAFNGERVGQYELEVYQQK